MSIVLRSEIDNLTWDVDENSADTGKDDCDPALGSSDIEEPITGTGSDEAIVIAQKWPCLGLL